MPVFNKQTVSIQSAMIVRETAQTEFVTEMQLPDSPVLGTALFSCDGAGVLMGEGARSDCDCFSASDPLSPLDSSAAFRLLVLVLATGSGGESTLSSLQQFF